MAKIVYECPACGHIYPGNFGWQRGQFQEGTGYGTQLTCTQTVPSRVPVPAPIDPVSRRVLDVPVYQVCGAPLVGREENNTPGSRRMPDGTTVQWQGDAEFLKAHPLKPIEPGRAAGNQ